jgi:ferredoxin
MAWRCCMPERSEGMSRVIVDHERCTGQGRCYSLSPDVFDSDDQGYSVVLVSEVEPGSDLAEQAQVAVRNCPESAIRVEHQ